MFLLKNSYLTQVSHLTIRENYVKICVNRPVIDGYIFGSLNYAADTSCNIAPDAVPGSSLAGYFLCPLGHIF